MVSFHPTLSLLLIRPSQEELSAYFVIIVLGLWPLITAGLTGSVLGTGCLCLPKSRDIWK